MAHTVLICGKSGSGKTTAMRTLNPKETVIFRAINRTLPFKGAGQYIEGRNMRSTPVFDGPEGLSERLKWANRFASVKNVVITDGTYIMRNEFMSKINDVGFKKFNDIGLHTKRLFDEINSMRDDITVFLEWHCATESSDSGAVTYVPSTVGSLVDRVSGPFENVDIILFAEPKYTNNTIEYGFYTNRVIGRGGIEIPAKSPMGMFEDIFIPNDAQLVVDTIRKYYGDSPVAQPSELQGANVAAQQTTSEIINTKE